MMIHNSYLEELHPEMYQVISPTPVSAPRLLLWNTELAKQINIPQKWQDDPQRLARIFSGNEIIPESKPIALAYAGHQFGHFVPLLGDGRAHLLGEVIDQDGQRFDIQLKGSGPTQFSRGGDGRCGLGPALREYIMSEALHALGVPTSRCLAVVLTGDTIHRNHIIPGAVVTRIASSHLRVGTFEYLAAQNNISSLRKIGKFAIKRHFPEIDTADDSCWLHFLKEFCRRQIRLITSWMQFGFIHGVMNTDNTGIAGETLDYGPCAMMGIYHPQTVFSSIDRNGRYCFNNQPQIAHWNTSQLASCFIPLIDKDRSAAIEKIKPILENFTEHFSHSWLRMMATKIGLKTVSDEETNLISSLLQKMMDKNFDYTTTFHDLTKSILCQATSAKLESLLGEWMTRWKRQLKIVHQSPSDLHQLMAKNNPVVIPRNHHVEAVLRECQSCNGNVSKIKEFLEVLRTPFQEQSNTNRYQDLPPDGDHHYQTFCGT